MGRKKKNKFLLKLKKIFNNFGILILILIIGFFGGKILQSKLAEFNNINSIKEEILNNDDNQNSSNQTTDDNNSESISKAIDNLEVNFTLEEKTNDIIAIIGNITSGEADKISVLTCSDNFSQDYDDNRYNLTSYEKGQEKFQFNTTTRFGNRCDIPYKFKFSLDGDEKVFSFDAGFDKRNPVSSEDVNKIINYYNASDLIFTDVDDYNKKAIIDNKQNCLNVLSSLDDKSGLDVLCSDADLALYINKLSDSIYEIKISENFFAGEIILDRFFDVKYNKEVFSYDERKEDEQFSYKQDGDLFLSNLFSYNTRYGELFNKSKTITADFTHYYYKESGMYFIINLDGSNKYLLKNITEDEISPNIKIENNYIAILEKLDNSDKNINKDIKIFYGEVYPGRNSIDLNSFTIKAQSLGCGEIIDHNMADYIDIVNGKIITNSSCSLELENPEFELN